MGPVLIVEVLELPQRLHEVALIPDERAVQQLVSACLHPAFHDRIHPRHLDPAEHDLDTRVLEDRVEQAGKLAVAVPDQEPRPAAGVLQIHDEIPGSLDDPRGCGMSGHPENPDPSGGVLDDRQHIKAPTG